MFRTAALAAATFAAATLLPALAATPAQASAEQCTAILEQAGHKITDATRDACKAGEESPEKCVTGLTADGVQDPQLVLVACLLAAAQTSGEV
ncbi:hypothetical protein [Saccharothrix australiensis]|uniref:Uncharacterized protein n=1 Tax=Saccharothrix australiensis TaxID=2072 RepID=A0A495VUZ6_9PSEU|nr:hypothetical protein [Saccharothrix australiensis]RKT53251.1 hypothetical protein C8E97_1810 [Saccharothrix australiensis]